MKVNYEYFDAVFEYLEYLEYPDLVIFYAPESVAKSLAPTIKTFQEYGVSPRMAAIGIWSATMINQIIPASQRETKQ